MKWYFFLFIPVFLTQSSCKSPPDESDEFSYLTNKAEQYGHENPDSAMAVYNYLLASQIADKKPERRPAILFLKAKLMEHLGDADSAVILYHLIMREAQLTGDSTQVPAATLHLGHYFLDRGYYSLAKKYYGKLTTDERVSPAIMARGLTGFASASTNSGNYPEAIEKYHQAMEIFLNLGDTVNASVQLQNLAVAHSENGNYELALSFNERAIATFLKYNDSVRLADSYINKAIYNKNLQKDSVINFYDSALMIYEQLKDSARINLITYNKAVYLIRSRPDEAADLLNQVLQFSKRCNINQGQVMALNALSDLYSLTNPSGALSLAQQAARKAAETGLKNLEMRVLKTVSNRLTEQKLYAQAVEQLLRINQLRDSLNSDLLSRNATEIQQLYLIAEIEQQNLALKSETAIQRLQFAAARKFGIAITIVAVIMAIFLVILFRYYKNSKIAYNALFDIYRQKQQKSISSDTRNFDDGKEIAIVKEMDSKLSHITDNLNRLINMEEIFRDRHLSALTMAEKMGISRRELSAHLQKEHGKNFAVFINRHRINFARKLIETIPENQLKLDYVATESGFNNRQTFYKTFHEVTGLTPGQYHSQLRNSS